MEIREIGADDVADVSSLASELWPDGNADEFNREFFQLLDGSGHKVFICRENQRAIAFAHFSLRHDYVEGALSSPVGYIEGIFVRRGYRKMGVARDLVARGEAWARSNGCGEFASDSLLSNHRSRKFHRKLGFSIANKIVCYIKKL
jgi:aminoglycoside 6'-N-acetyltransferase I